MPNLGTLRIGMRICKVVRDENVTISVLKIMREFQNKLDQTNPNIDLELKNFINYFIKLKETNFNYIPSKIEQEKIIFELNEVYKKYDINFFQFFKQISGQQYVEIMEEIKRKMNDKKNL